MCVECGKMKAMPAALARLSAALLPAGSRTLDLLGPVRMNEGTRG